MASTAVQSIFDRHKVTSLSKVSRELWTWPPPPKKPSKKTTNADAEYESIMDMAGESDRPARMAVRAWLILSRAHAFGQPISRSLASNQPLIAAALGMMATFDADRDLGPAALSTVSNLCVLNADEVAASMLVSLRGANARARAGTLTVPRDPLVCFDLITRTKGVHDDDGDDKMAMKFVRLSIVLAEHDELYAEVLERVRLSGFNIPELPESEDMPETFLQLVVTLRKRSRFRSAVQRAGETLTQCDATSSVQSVMSSLRRCANHGCGLVESRKGQHKVCGACREVSYCGARCQKEHWKAHKAVCKKSAESRAQGD
jgi:hypothetical protein